MGIKGAGDMLNKPVEVWCVINPTGKGPDIVGIGFDEIDAWIDFGIENPTQGEEYQGRGYRCERRLLMHEGETFADGVEAAINHLALSGVIKIDGVFAKELRALSPAPENTPSQSPMRRENAASNGLLRGSVDGVPSEADKLLRELEAELDAMSWAQNAARDKDLARRVQDYLKERG